MDSETEAVDRTVRPAGSKVELVKELMKQPVYGLLFFVVIVVEGALFLAYYAAEGSMERSVALGGFVGIIVLVLVFFSRERGRYYELESQRLTATAAVPGSMVADPIPDEVVRREADIMTAPDGTFVYSKPPPGWTVAFTSFLDQARHELNQQYLDVPADAPLPFRAGELVVFQESKVYEIAYIPGRSLLNGRPVIGALADRFSSQVIMFSVSKLGGLIRDISAEHVFAQILIGVLAIGSKIEEIREAPSEVGGRRTLTARGTKRFEHVMIDGSETARAILDLRLHVVEHENFLYVIQTHFIEGGADSQSRRERINDIVSSFRAASTANAAEREAKDVKEADASFEKAVTDVAPAVLMLKVQGLVEEMRTPGGTPLVSARHLEHARLLEDYAKAFPKFVPDETRDLLALLRDSVEKAILGEPGQLAELINEEVEPDPEPTLITDERPDAAEGAN